MTTEERGLTRRQFVQGTATAAAAMTLARSAFAEEPSSDAEPLRIGHVGCGGRGTGAAEDCLKSSKNVKLVALADMFPDRAARCRKYLESKEDLDVELSDACVYTGFDA